MATPFRKKVAMAVKHRVRWLVFALALVAIAAAWWWRLPTPAPVPHNGATVSRPSTAASIVATDLPMQRADLAKPEAGQPAASATAPPTTTEPPLRDVFATLDAAARSGNARAACRLGAELERCAIAERMGRFYRDEQQVKQLAVQTLSEEDMQREIDNIAARRDILDAVADHCAGVAPDTIRAAADYVGMAAAAGHVPSQIEILTGRQLQTAALLRDATPLATYRNNASTYFRNALEAGDLAVLELWNYSTRVGDSMPLTQYLPAEWREPGVVLALIELLSDEQRQSVFPPGLLDHDRVAPTAAQMRIASDLYTRHFAASPPLRGRLTDPNLDQIQMMKRTLSVDRFRCDDGLH